ncbi:MAG: hypothetical protein PSV23_03665 [Brevundimonas sp.]|uniref:hypothetical protein n=1 Tax=Brevundimonas sp. TaxID=1871086 RepID=UPI00248848C2|nr:hypothetical protein [Brevundimonas sp.]MDI1325879.1 hypothetical protein [Brevundimonas sp.]
MLNRNLLAVIGTAFALLMGQAAPAAAQQEMPRSPDTPGNLTDPNTAPTRRGEAASRMPRRSQRQAAPAAPTPEQIMAEAQAQVTAAGLGCQVTGASQPGVTAEQVKIYEAACATGPGYILIASTPPQSFDCLELAGTAYTARLRDPAADVGQQCALPANQNGLAVIGGWAREAGAACTIDEAVAIGKSDQNNIVYEVGCAGVDGYWLEKVATGWKLQDCLQVASVGGTCRFTTTQEQADGFEPKLAGTEASACDVSQVRLMGQNANGRFYEAKCAAEGEGFIARVNTEGATQQVYPCATAQRIGGGCTLTPAPAVAPEPAPAE